MIVELNLKEAVLISGGGRDYLRAYCDFVMNTADLVDNGPWHLKHVYCAASAVFASAFYIGPFVCGYTVIGAAYTAYKAFNYMVPDDSCNNTNATGINYIPDL